MILLKRLRVHALKQLRDVDVWFPRRGSLLIEGQNEAGKSTLFEAVYFALYGSPLVGEDTRATLEDLMPHGGSSAAVELTVATGVTELEIRRNVAFSRGKTHAAQQARVRVRRPGEPMEEIHGPRPVNARILRELHELDADTLRNSCFMEQKALDRLEALTRGQREVAIARLLGLDHLQRVARALDNESVELRRQFEVAKGELEVAAWQRQAREARDRAQLWETRAAAAEIRDLIARRDTVEDVVSGQSERIAALRDQTLEAEQQVRAAEDVKALLENIQAARPYMQEALDEQRRYDALRDDLARLDRLERDEELPLVERAARLRDIEAVLSSLRAAERDVAQLSELSEAVAAVARSQVASDEARRECASLEARCDQLEARDRLQDWIRATERSMSSTDSDAERERLVQARDERELTAHRARSRARALLVATCGVGLVAVVCAAAGLGAHAWWIIAGVFIALSIGVGVTWRAAQQRATLARGAADEARDALTRLDVRAELSHAVPVSPGAIAEIEAALTKSGVTPPVSLSEAQHRIAELAPADEQTLRHAREERDRARTTLTQRVTQTATAEEILASARRRLDPRFAQLETQDDVTAALAAARERHIAVHTEADALATSSRVALDESALAVERGAVEARLTLTREQLSSRGSLRQAADTSRETLTARTAELAHDIARLVAGAQALGIDATELTTDTADLAALELAWKELHGAVATAYMRLDEVATRERLAGLASRREEVERGAQAIGADHSTAALALKEALARQGVACSGDESLTEMCALWPPLAESKGLEVGEIERELLAARNEAFHASETASRAASARNLEGVALDEDACRDRVAAVERDVRRHETAARLAAETQGRIFRRVLPETGLHMRALLPELTEGRYRDVELIADENAGGADLRIRVWDQLAGRYVAKNLFSGGARDQFSLALRLAFALATLPKEVGATPGFVFLDEPLSSFDAERSLALVEILTRGPIARQFAQVMLVSHGRSFDPGQFDFRLRMAGGRIVESNLPDEREAERLWAVESAVVERAEQ